jgi:hypothetical protein
MRELIGYLVACRGAEEVDVWTAAGIPQRFLCKDDRADHALIDDESIAAGSAIGEAPSIARTLTDDILTDRGLTDSVGTGSPITIIYARENFTDDAVAEIARAIPGFGVLD